MFTHVCRREMITHLPNNLKDRNGTLTSIIYNYGMPRSLFSPQCRRWQPHKVNWWLIKMTIETNRCHHKTTRRQLYAYYTEYLRYILRLNDTWYATAVAGNPLNTDLIRRRSSACVPGWSQTTYATLCQYNGGHRCIIVTKMSVHSYRQGRV